MNREARETAAKITGGLHVSRRYGGRGSAIRVHPWLKTPGRVFSHRALAAPFPLSPRKKTPTGISHRGRITQIQLQPRHSAFPPDQSSFGTYQSGPLSREVAAYFRVRFAGFAVNPVQGFIRVYPCPS